MSNFKLKTLDTEDERAFVVRYWLDSYKNNAPFGKMVAPKVFFKFHKRLVVAALDKHKTLLIIDSEDSEHIIGFINYNETDAACYVNYILIKEKFRNSKLGIILFMNAFDLTLAKRSKKKPLVLTHQGNLMGLTKYFSEVIFNPYKAFELLQKE